jgi:hypothetical protein
MFTITREPPEGQVKPLDHPQISGLEVYHWPEFQAFANRLGIPLEAFTVDLFIEIPCDDLVKVFHVYRGVDGHENDKAIANARQP